MTKIDLEGFEQRLVIKRVAVFCLLFLGLISSAKFLYNHFAVTKAEGEPTIISATTGDADQDGKIDKYTILFSEPMDTSVTSTAGFSVVLSAYGPGAVGTWADNATFILPLNEQSDYDTGADLGLSYSSSSGDMRDVGLAEMRVVTDQNMPEADGAAPVAALTYSTDGGTTWASTAVVNSTNTLRIKATFPEIMCTEACTTSIQIDNNILSWAAGDMTRIDDTHYYYDLDVPNGDVNVATISIDGNDLSSNDVVETPISGATFTIDNTVPVAPTISTVASPVDADSQTITGTAEANSLVTITGGAATATQQLTGGATAYSIVVTLTQDTTNTLSVTATDAAGNVSSAAAATIIETVSVPASDTTPPTVSAGSNMTAYPNSTITQDATVSDATTYAWTKVSGSGDITFGSADAEDTTVKASEAGTYVLRLTASDAAGNAATSDMTFTVYKAGDINNDSKIDNDDFTLLLFNWGAPTNTMADFGLAGKVDNDDFTILMYWWS
ncbi:MAG: Ig-like domain-containing protein [Patescibacteria group bacterium]|jgi:hypothetical protein